MRVLSEGWEGANRMTVCKDEGIGRSWKGPRNTRDRDGRAGVYGGEEKSRLLATNKRAKLFRHRTEQCTGIGLGFGFGFGFAHTWYIGSPSRSRDAMLFLEALKRRYNIRRRSPDAVVWRHPQCTPHLQKAIEMLACLPLHLRLCVVSSLGIRLGFAWIRLGSLGCTS